jgi:hypothetical protein
VILQVDDAASEVEVVDPARLGGFHANLGMTFI